MKIIKSIALLSLMVTMFSSCKKEETKFLAEKLENNTMMFDGKLFQIYRAVKNTYVNPACSGQGILGGLSIYASNANRDSVRIFIDNITSYTTGTKNPVEYGISGSTCKLYFFGTYKPFNGSVTGTPIKSVFSGTLVFDNNTCIFREDGNSPSANPIPPKLYSQFNDQVRYDCYWKCSF